MTKKERIAAAVTGGVLFCVAALFSISIFLGALDFGFSSGHNVLFLLGGMLFSVYGFCSILIPVFFFIAGAFCLSAKWSVQRAFILLISVIPFFTLVLAERASLSIAAQDSSPVASVKIISLVVIALLLVALEYLLAVTVAGVVEKALENQFSFKDFKNDVKTAILQKLPFERKVVDRKVDKQLNNKKNNKTNSDTVKKEATSVKSVKTGKLKKHDQTSDATIVASGDEGSPSALNTINTIDNTPTLEWSVDSEGNVKEKPAHKQAAPSVAQGQNSADSSDLSDKTGKTDKSEEIGDYGSKANPAKQDFESKSDVGAVGVTDEIGDTDDTNDADDTDDAIDNINVIDEFEKQSMEAMDLTAHIAGSPFGQSDFETYDYAEGLQNETPGDDERFFDDDEFLDDDFGEVDEDVEEIDDDFEDQEYLSAIDETEIHEIESYQQDSGDFEFYDGFQQEPEDEPPASVDVDNEEGSAKGDEEEPEYFDEPQDTQQQSVPDQKTDAEDEYFDEPRADQVQDIEPEYFDEHEESFGGTKGEYFDEVQKEPAQENEPFDEPFISEGDNEGFGEPHAGEGEDGELEIADDGEPEFFDESEEESNLEECVESENKEFPEPQLESVAEAENEADRATGVTTGATDNIGSPIIDSIDNIDSLEAAGDSRRDADGKKESENRWLEDEHEVQTLEKGDEESGYFGEPVIENVSGDTADIDDIDDITEDGEGEPELDEEPDVTPSVTTPSVDENDEPSEYPSETNSEGREDEVSLAAEDESELEAQEDVAGAGDEVHNETGEPVVTTGGEKTVASDEGNEHFTSLESIFKKMEQDAKSLSAASPVLPPVRLNHEDEAHDEPPPRKKAGPYKISEDLLTVYEENEYWIIDQETETAAKGLKDTLSEFKIEAEVTGIRKGPVVTMFEILPAPGVKLSRIVALSDNIALRLAASSVRIVAPIPGKRAVGIEVPNKNRAIVSFRECIEEQRAEWKKMAVPVVLGKDIQGETQIMDLVKTPHLLIAGSTGAGKSVCVNSMILSILYKRTPHEVKLILIDPKIVELKLYNGIPHLLTPVITEPKKAMQALQYCLCEMERRYSVLDGMGCRDIASYNRKIAEQHIATEKLPYIIVIIDEFADLMATTGKALESVVARLAAMSRAVGIHLVLATQRPSVDVITGLIKANIPSRIAFMVAAKMDSRIIIDQVGAEKLLGKGDMLYASSTDPFPVRIQGAFVSDQEVENVAQAAKEWGEPEYIDDEIFVDEEDSGEQTVVFGDGEDPLYEKALDAVIQAGKASASYVQRKLSIGYNRAARLIEEMEERGIVGPANGSKPREIIHVP